MLVVYIQLMQHFQMVDLELNLQMVLLLGDLNNHIAISNFLQKL
jgi:hypothetical protein